MAIQNRQQLLAAVSEWTTHAKNDIRNQLIRFMETRGTNAEELAYALGLPNGVIEQILNGNGEISLTTFATLLIATNNVLEIKPLSVTPMGRGMKANTTKPHKATPKRDARGRFAPTNNGMPMPPMGYPMPPMGQMPMGGMTMPPVDYPMPPMGGMPMPPMGEAPQRFGGMPGMGRVNGSRPAMESTPIPPTSEFDELSTRQLLGIINQNGWSHEADFANMSRGELIDFLDMKTVEEQPTPQPTTNTTLDAVNEEMTAQNEAESASASETELAQMLASELANNPQLRGLIDRFVGANR